MYRSVCVHSCHWLSQADKGCRRGGESEQIYFFRGYSKENLNLRGVERSQTPAVLQPRCRQPSHSELSPQAFTGLFQVFKSFQERSRQDCSDLSTCTVAASSPFQILQVSAYVAPFGACGFCFLFAQKDFSNLFCLLILTGVSAASSFWGCLPTFPGPQAQQATVLLRVTCQSRFRDYLKNRDSVKKRFRMSWNCIS